MLTIKVSCAHCGQEQFIQIPGPANDNGIIWMSSNAVLTKEGRPQAIAAHMKRFGKKRSQIGRGMQERIDVYSRQGGLILNVNGTVHIPAKNDVKRVFGATWHYISGMLAYGHKPTLAQGLTKTTLPCWRVADLACRLDGAKFD
jgi:hypothetical protein